ncbi:hypothetical protein [Paenibacillus puerhi]|uniref:hypothetical protein n=1 Tax=Paenibacillus puerhi TaxID=2692622 RepID=UPI001358D4BC|nr:hypothetical protein [Paenibacillus puerhi]
MKDIELLLTAKRYAPALQLDIAEPFEPIRAGITFLDRPGDSPSFNRRIEFDPEQVKGVLEYAVYWDYDIQHLYDLEHVWIFLGHQGEIVRCEASFHGKYLLGLLPDRSNIEQDMHVRLLVQAGKHAFSPMPELFRLLPDVPACCQERAGEEGVLVPRMFENLYPADDRLHRLAKRHLQAFRFQPLHRYRPYTWAEDAMVPWPQLQQEIPVRMNRLLRRLEDEEAAR